MTTDDPRDRALERLLGRRPDTAASADCLDAETIAAWADGGLDAPALARAEAHMSGCARCQTVMATLVQMPVEEATGIEAAERQPRPWWHIDMRWLVPLAGAATAVLVWMVVPGSRQQPQPATFEAKSSIATREPSQPSAEEVPPSAPAATAPAATAVDTPATPRRDLGARQEAEGRLAQREPAGSALAKERPAETADQLAKVEAPAAALERGAAHAPPPSANAAAAAEKQNAPAAPAASGFSAEADAARGKVGAASPALSIVSRDPAVRWRPRGDRVVERSVDGGATWTPADTGTAAVLLAGASPSASVCWMVGRGGVVLLTTNARTWQRVASPVADDLVAVEATDERHATVRTSAGASYQTTDAGSTWNRL